MRRRWVIAGLALAVAIGLAVWALWRGAREVSGDTTHAQPVAGVNGATGATAHGHASDAIAADDTDDDGGDDDDDDRPDVRLSPDVSGTVTDEDGKPVPGATVQLFDLSATPLLSDRPHVCTDDGCESSLFDCECSQDIAQLIAIADARREPTALLTATSDAQGHFEFHGLTSADLRIVALSGAREGEVDLTGDEDTADIELAARASLTGTLTGADGSPIPNVPLVALHDSGRAFDAFAGHDGTFTFKDLPPGDYRVLVQVEGYLPHAESAEVPASDGALEITLERPKTVSGIVLEAGAPAADVEVTAEIDHRTISVRTDAQGEFSIDGLPEEDVKLTAHKGALVASRVEYLQEGTTDVELTLGVPLELAVRVVGEDGRPISGADVSTSLENGQTMSETSDDGGVARLAVYTAAELRVSVSAPDAVDTEDVPVKPAPPGGAPTDVTLRHAEPLRGVVVDEHGEPVPEVRVAAIQLIDGERFATSSEPNDAPESEDDGPNEEGRGHAGGGARTNATGEFEVRGLPPGRYRVEVSSPRFEPARAATTTPGDPLRIVLHRGGVLTGRVLNVDGSPSEGAVVTWSGTSESESGIGHLGDGRRHMVSTDDDGGFEFGGLADGEYHLVASIVRGEDDSGPASVTARATVKNGTGPEVTLRFGTGLTLDGTVADESGRPVEGAQVYARMQSGSMHEPPRMFNSGDTDAAGHFHLSGLEPGTVLLSVSGDDVTDKADDDEHPIQLPHRDPVRLTVHRYPRLIGRVLGANGKPLGFFDVGGESVNSGDGTFSVANTEEEGQTVVVSASGYASTPVRVPAAHGRDVNVGDVRLERGHRLLGVAFLPDGSPAKDAELEVYLATPEVPAGEGDEDDEYSSLDLYATTGPDGAFNFAHVPDAPLTLSARLSGNRPVEVPIAVGQTQVRVEFAEGARISGRVIDDAGRPVSTGKISVQGEGFGLRAVLLSADGSFTIENVDAGERYRLRLIDGPPGLVRNRVVTVEEDRPTVVELGPPCLATLRFLHADGTPSLLTSVRLSNEVTENGRNPSMPRPVDPLSDPTGRHTYAVDEPVHVYVVAVDHSVQPAQLYADSQFLGDACGSEVELRMHPASADELAKQGDDEP